MVGVHVVMGRSLGSVRRFIMVDRRICIEGAAWLRPSC